MSLGVVKLQKDRNAIHKFRLLEMGTFATRMLPSLGQDNQPKKKIYRKLHKACCLRYFRGRQHLFLQVF
jgi:hypothetical protein